MSEAYLGEIRLFGGTFAPQGWLACDGQLLAISQYDALFSLLGTTYGGDGQTTFALPDLRGRMPMHAGAGFVLGQAGGVETVTLLTAHLPAHSHSVFAVSQPGNADAPTNAVWANAGSLSLFNPAQPDASFNPNAILPAGGSQPHDNMMPFLGVTFIICTEGIYPVSQ